MSPSGVSTIAIGPIPPSLWPMPVAKARPVKGLSTDSTSLGADSGSAAGTFASACVNNSLVEDVGEGAGACPKLGGVVPGTVGVAPSVTSATPDTPLTPG